jgi:hypothetical protein
VEDWNGLRHANVIWFQQARSIMITLEGDIGAIRLMPHPAIPNYAYHAEHIQPMVYNLRVFALA